MKKKLYALAALLLSAVLLFAGCGGGSDNTEAADPLADGVLTAAVDDTYLPMEFRNDKNGECQENSVSFLRA